MILNIIYDKQGKIIPIMNGKQVTMNESPFLIFLSSIGMCSAVYVRSFLSQREMPFNDIVINQKMEFDKSIGMVTKIDIELDLPDNFPVKYNNAIKKVVDQCLVKRHLVDTPNLNVITNIDKKAAA